MIYPSCPETENFGHRPRYQEHRLRCHRRKICRTGKDDFRSASTRQTLRLGKTSSTILLPILTSVLAVEQTYFPHDRNGSALNRFSKRSNRSGGTPQGGAFRQIPFGNVCGYGRARKRDVTTVLSSLSISGHTDGRIDDGRTSPFLAFIPVASGTEPCRRKFHQSVM